MCTGFEWLMVASTALQTMSRLDQGEQEQQSSNFQAEQSEADAQAEREAGEVRATKVRKQGKYQQSEARASLAASGVEVTAGTPVRIEQQIVRNAEEDALNEILYGTRRGDRLDQDAALYRQAGERAHVAGQRRAVGSVLSGGAAIVGAGWKKAVQRPTPSGDFPMGDYPIGGEVRIS